MIRPYLTNIEDGNKTPGEWKVHSGNRVIDYKTQGEWKIQLTLSTNSISCTDSEETCTLSINNVSIEIMEGN